MKPFFLALLCSVVVLSTVGVPARVDVNQQSGATGSAPTRSFTLESATIESINAAFDAGALTSEKLIGMYLARIAAYENKGPNINAFININTNALSVARTLDEERRTKGKRSALHGIPVVLKDAYNTS